MDNIIRCERIPSSPCFTYFFQLRHLLQASDCCLFGLFVLFWSRYLEGCAGQVLKRKSESHSLATSSSSSSTSEEDKPAGASGVVQTSSDGKSTQSTSQFSVQNKSRLLTYFHLTFQWLCWTVRCLWALQLQQLSGRLWQTSQWPLRPWVLSRSLANVRTAAPSSTCLNPSQVLNIYHGRCWDVVSHLWFFDFYFFVKVTF